MEKYTNLIFSGEKSDFLIEPIKNSRKKFGYDKLIIVVPEKKESQFSKIKDQNSDMFDEICIREINTKDMVQCALEILDIIRDEKQAGKKGVALNISNSLPVFILSGYIAASLTRSPVIMLLNSDLVEVPRVPYCKPLRIRYEILAEIPDEGIDSQESLRKRIEHKIPEINKSIEKKNEKLLNKKKLKIIPHPLSRSYLSQHLKTLESKGFIEKEGSSKNEGSDERTKRIRLTSFGKLIKQSYEVMEIAPPSK
jgi:DNA-binding HxlR family transcriptional regulator